MKALARFATPRLLIAACTIGLPAIVLLIGVLLAMQTQRNDAAGQAVMRSSAVRVRLQRVFSLLQDAETGQRGYLLTGQDKYLQPYKAATRHISPDMSLLADRLQADPAQRARMGRLEYAVSGKMAELAKTVALQRTGNHQAALALMASGAGYDLMDDARKLTSDIQAAQDREVRVEVAARTASYSRTFWFVGGLLSALTLLLGFSATMALLNFRAGKKIIAEVRLLTEQLQSEKKRLLQMVRELDDARMSADEANKAKSEFLASMSHELRTPLNAILGFSEIIKDELFGPVGMHQYVDYANDVHKSGQHLLDLINDVLDLSKIQAGRVELREENVDLSDLLRDSISLTRERALKGGVSLVSGAPSSGPFVLADRRLLKQILLNLLSNAIKFTPQGGTVTGTTFCDGLGIGIAIQDTGIGMTREDTVKAMQLYGQVDSKVSRKHKGTGLGLPISQSLAALHGGTLAIDSEPGRGTTITLTLPASRAITAAPAGDDAHKQHDDDQELARAGAGRKPG
ncbi:MAG: Signal transduction histidine kinase [Alphaproteobacteria bacterium]|nr:Signal transduction histidine kinase [Alphaproteobacteria bacterium]